MTNMEEQGAGLIPSPGSGKLAVRSADLAQRGLALAQRLRSQAAIITIANPPFHGIGATTIATNVAAAIAKAGRRVALVDLDLRFGDVAILMDIPVERSILDLAIPEEEITRERIEECLYQHDSGVHILPAPIRPNDWRSVHAGHIERVVSILTQSYDYIVLDACWFNRYRSAELASIVVLVALASRLKDTLLMLDMLQSWNFPQLEKIRLVINATNEADYVQPQEVKRMLGLDVFWSIPYDRNISTATQLGMPLVMSHPESTAAQSMRGLADALTDELNRISRQSEIAP